MRDRLLAEGMLGPQDFDLFTVTDCVDEVCDLATGTPRPR
jgi:hypothetical protein